MTRQEVQFLRIISRMHAQGLREQNSVCLDSYAAATTLHACSKYDVVPVQNCNRCFFMKQILTVVGQIDKDCDCTATIIIEAAQQ